MNRSIRTLMTTAALALGALGAVGAAHAGPQGPYGYYGPQAQVAPRPYPGSAPVDIYEDPHRRFRSDHDIYNGYGYRTYSDRHAYNDHGRGHRFAQRCGAQPWQPGVRYMPGAVVWRKGELYQARPISNRVYNENSPPEWTPNYWAPAICR